MVSPIFSHVPFSRLMPIPFANTASLRQSDVWLLSSALTLLLLGLVMVASASVHFATERYGEAFYFFYRQLGYAGLGLLVAGFCLALPIAWWRRYSVYLLLSGLLLLILVLIPGLGREVNGSMRWFNVAGISLQPSELMKLFMPLYLAGYLVRRRHEVRASSGGFIKPLIVQIIITWLLLQEPDYGAAVVLFATALGMLFLAGVPWRLFISWGALVSAALFFIIWLAPYRVKRLTVFLDPWADPFNSGFQLTQALIAIGRGDWFGEGLGNSVQKLTYLPEAHTDFLFAIIAEELGLLGGTLVIALFALLLVRALLIARRAEHQGHEYAAYLAYGLGLVLGLQAMISLGVNMGVLPTKGLTLPLMSYGGSSLLVSCAAIGLLARIAYENTLPKPSSS